MNNRFDKNFRPQNPTFLTNNGVNQSKTSMQIHLVDKCNVYTLQSLPFCSIVIFNNKTTSVLQFNFAFLFLSFKFLVCLKALVFLLIQEPKESRNSQNVILHICRSSCLLVSSQPHYCNNPVGKLSSAFYAGTSIHPALHECKQS